jgi:hypothetical protein
VREDEESDEARVFEASSDLGFGDDFEQVSIWR